MVIYMLKSRTHGNTKSTKQKTINNARASIKKRKRQQQQNQNRGVRAEERVEASYARRQMAQREQNALKTNNTSTKRVKVGGRRRTRKH